MPGHLPLWRTRHFMLYVYATDHLEPEMLIKFLGFIDGVHDGRDGIEPAECEPPCG
jgi:hypothetical protein